tara:strand:+ start:1700 stop:1879 length:180 start_codon:yes stop_codon:yes gene_type:complete
MFDLEEKVLDKIEENGLEFGGRAEDVSLVIEILVELGVLVDPGRMDEYYRRAVNEMGNR